MSIYFMRENHTFIRLDDKSIHEAVWLINEYCSEQPTHGFVGCKGEHGQEIYQWKPEDNWQPKVVEMLSNPAQ